MPGAAASLVIVAIGAILDFATTVSPYQHGFNIQTAGLILMILGAIGFIVSLIAMASSSGGWYASRRRRTIIDDGQGNVVRREDSYQ